jgi:hypothetical protein
MYVPGMGRVEEVGEMSAQVADWLRELASCSVPMLALVAACMVQPHWTSRTLKLTIPTETPLEL